MKKLGDTLQLCPISHYHRVEDATYHAVMSFLRDVLCSSMERSNGRIYFRLSPYLQTEILYFIEQMEIAYLHPRATSRRWLIHCHSLNEKKPK